MAQNTNTKKIPKTFPIRPEHPNDVISEINGDFGRWQLRTILLIFLCKIPSSWFMACVVFTAPTPKPGNYYCKPPDNININDTKTWIRISHPAVLERESDRGFHIDFCNVYHHALYDKKFQLILKNYSNPFLIPKEFNASNIVPCNKFKFLTEFNSLITDFDLVCTRQVLISVTQSFHALGTLIGGLLSRQLLNKISPKGVMMIGMIAQIICGNLTGLVNKFALHNLFRCLTALFCAFMISAGEVIIQDITSGKARIIIITLFQLYWSIGLIVLPGIAIFFDNWTILYISISSPTIILVFLCRYITNSPRWLLKKGKIEKTLGILLESATYNGKKIPLDLEHRLKQYQTLIKANNKTKYIEIWDGSTKRNEIFAVHWAWVWSVTLYNAMITNIRAFGVDYLYSNTVILGFAEMFGILAGLLLILYTRRHWFWAGSIFSIAGFLTLFIWVVPSTIKEHRRIGVDMIFCTFLKLANAMSMAILTTCTKEIVKAEKRPMLMFSVITYSRICLLFAPFITALSIIHQLIPITVFAFLGILAGFFMIFLNSSYWDDDQPKILEVPTTEIYRKNSQIIIAQQESAYDNMPYVTITNLLNFTTCELPKAAKFDHVSPAELAYLKN